MKYSIRLFVCFVVFSTLFSCAGNPPRREQQSPGLVVLTEKATFLSSPSDHFEGKVLVSVTVATDFEGQEVYEDLTDMGIGASYALGNHRIVRFFVTPTPPVEPSTEYLKSATYLLADELGFQPRNLQMIAMEESPLFLEQPAELITGEWSWVSETDSGAVKVIIPVRKPLNSSQRVNIKVTRVSGSGEYFTGWTRRLHVDFVQKGGAMLEWGSDLEYAQIVIRSWRLPVKPKSGGEAEIQAGIRQFMEKAWPDMVKLENQSFSFQFSR